MLPGMGGFSGGQPLFPEKKQPPPPPQQQQRPQVKSNNVRSGQQQQLYGSESASGGGGGSFRGGGGMGGGGGMAWATALAEPDEIGARVGAVPGGSSSFEYIKGEGVASLVDGLCHSSHLRELALRRKADALRALVESDADPPASSYGSVPELRAEFSLPSQTEIDELRAQLGAQFWPAGSELERLPPSDQLTVLMSSLQSELQRLLHSVHEWCEHALAEQQDLGWEISLVFSIELSQAAKRMHTQHAQIGLSYAPLPRQRAEAHAEAHAAANAAAHAAAHAGSAHDGASVGSMPAAATEAAVAKGVGTAPWELGTAPLELGTAPGALGTAPGELGEMATAAAAAQAAMSEAFETLGAAQQTTMEELSLGLATASEDAISRADESRSKTGGTAARLCRFLRSQLPAAARRFAESAEMLLKEAAEAAHADPEHAHASGVSSPTESSRSLAAWHERLREVRDEALMTSDDL